MVTPLFHSMYLYIFFTLKTEKSVNFSHHSHLPLEKKERAAAEKIFAGNERIPLSYEGRGYLSWFFFFFLLQ